MSAKFENANNQLIRKYISKPLNFEKKSENRTMRPLISTVKSIVDILKDIGEEERKFKS